MPYIPKEPFTIDIEGQLYGDSLYGESLYNDFWQYNDPQFEYINNLFDIRGVTVVFRDFGGNVIERFSTNSANFPFSALKFSYSIAKGCASASFVMLQRPESLGFTITSGSTIVEFYLFRSTTPWWSGIISSPAVFAGSSGLYKFEAAGFSNRLDKIIIHGDSEESSIIITTPIEVSQFIKTYVLPILLNDIPQLNVDYSKIVDSNVYMNNIKFDMSKASSVLSKCANICDNYIYGIDESYNFFFMPKNQQINSLCVFSEGSKDNLKMEVKETNSNKLVNKYYIYVKNENSDTNTTTILTGVVNAKSSQNIYGVISDKLTLPDDVDGNTAAEYALKLLSYRAWPDYTAKVSGINALKLSEQPIKPDGQSMRTISRPDWNIESIDDLKDISCWTTDDSVNLTLAAETEICHSKGNCVLMAGTTSSANKTATFQFYKAKNFNSKKSIHFWVKSNRKGGFITVRFGDDTNGYTDYPIYIASTTWERVSINIQNHVALGAITKIKFKITDAASAFQAYIDQLEVYYYGSKIIDTEISEVVYSFEKGNYSVQITGGTPDIPYVDEFLRVQRKINLLESCTYTK